MKLLIKNGLVFDTLNHCTKKTDLLINNGIIEKIGDGFTEYDNEIDASGLWVTPGFIDLHCHLRDPGLTHKETINSGTLSAVSGGFTTVCCMPNTKPVTDNIETVKYITEKAKLEGFCNVLPVGAITKGMESLILSDIEGMKNNGICAISEDGKSVLSAYLLKEGMKIASSLDIPVFSHCEDISLVNGGVVNEGIASRLLNLKGISCDSEYVIVARDILLSKSTGARLHICHVSTKGSVEIIRLAKENGINVTAEVCPHHFTLTDDFIKDMDTNTKMNPPLRSKEDLEEILLGLKDGTLSVIATDHAPHTAQEKARPYDKAPFGIVGFETALPLSITYLVNKGILTPIELIEKLTINPAKVLGIDKGVIKEGGICDLAIINPDLEYKINCEEFKSLSKNSPFNGFKVKGKVIYTIVNGEIKVNNS